MLQEHGGRLKTSGSVSLKAFKMYYMMRASAPSLHRESTDSDILCLHACLFQICLSWKLYTVPVGYSRYNTTRTSASLFMDG